MSILLLDHFRFRSSAVLCCLLILSFAALLSDARLNVGLLSVAVRAQELENGPPASPLPTATASPQFLRQVRPILAEYCFQCHGPDEGSREGGLRLDLAEAALLGGDSGVAAIVPGSPHESELLRRIVTSDSSERMPPDDLKRPLDAAQQQILNDWIAAGAEYQSHWALEPLQRPEVQVVHEPESPQRSNDADSSVPSSAIDVWIRTAWPSDLSAPPAADRYRLARRAALDLTGLPPERERVDDFVQDSRPDAWTRYVDRLLASPRYGERWGWPWLDAARYADSNGYQGDSDRTMWPWRDWVIDALNRDLPFDQWTEWQLAGDLLDQPTEEQRLATGFLRNHMINGEGGRIAEENRVDYVMDMTETTGTVWLAATLNCARCHDHKFDPISRRDYYRWFAFFDRTPVDGGGGNPRTPPVMNWPTDDQRRRLAELATKLESSATTLSAFEADTAPSDGEAPATVAVKDRNQDQWRNLLNDPETPAEQATAIREQIALLDQRDQLSGEIPVVMVMGDVPQPRTTYMLNKGLYTAQEEAVEAGVPEVFGSWDSTQANNRLGLARWLIDQAHPVTARVAVNRLWQELFGIGLVKTSEDFGSQGEPPANALLLNGLAHEFRESGWSTKHLVRKLMLSAAYRADTTRYASAAEVDPANRWLLRGARHRLPSWMIRDQALAVSGLLVDRIGGPSVHPYQPEGVWQEATFGARGYPQSHGSDLHRRSLYTFWRRIIAPTMFFDASSRQTCTVNVSRTNTPLQALATLNDVTYVEAARILADETLLDPAFSASSDWVAAMFRRILIRPATEAELQILTASFERHREHFAADPAAAEALLSFGEAQSMAAASSLPKDLRAAATTIASTLLNLDEAISKE